MEVLKSTKQADQLRHTRLMMECNYARIGFWRISGSQRSQWNETERCIV